MLAVFKREFKSYFHNIIGWLFVAFIMAAFGLYFYVYNLNSGYPYLYYSLSAISVFMMIGVPILTMRCFSEDTKNKTDQLTLTAPVSVWKIVLGKYLALAAVYSIDILIICAAPIILNSLGEVPLGESYLAILGYWLYGLSCIAVGMFVSALTESQIIAAVISFAILFLSYMEAGIVSLFFTEANLLTKILDYFDLYAPFESFCQGCLSVSGIIYYLTVIFLFCYLTVQRIQKRRYQVTRKRFSLGLFSAGMIAAVIAVVVVINLIVSVLPESWTSIDCSYNQMYSITDNTKEFLKGLDEDIDIYVLAQEANKDTTLDETLARYESLSDHIKVEYVSTSTNPYFYKEYTDTVPTSNSMIVVAKDSGRSKVIDYNDVYEYEYGMDYTTYSMTTTVNGYDAEGQISSAIEYVTMDASELPKAYTITGHGEVDLGTSFDEIFEKANVQVEDLELFNEEAVPDDADMLIINAPQDCDFNEEDAQKVIDYINGGGNVILVANYKSVSFANFNSILEAFGVTMEDGIVAETSNSNYYQIPFYLLPTVNHTVYSGQATDGYILMPYSVAFTYPDTSAEDAQEDDTQNGADTDESLTYRPILVTSENAILKHDIENMSEIKVEEGDQQGTFTVGLAVEKEIDENTTGHLLAYGSAYTFSDDANTRVSGNHGNLLTSMMSQLIGDVSLTTSVIPAKSMSLSNITVAALPAFLFGLVTGILIPVILLVIGIVIWMRRRKL